MFYPDIYKLKHLHSLLCIWPTRFQLLNHTHGKIYSGINCWCWCKLESNMEIKILDSLECRYLISGCLFQKYIRIFFQFCWLLCRSFLFWCSPSSLFLPLFPLHQETYLEISCYSRCQASFCLCSLLGF